MFSLCSFDTSTEALAPAVLHAAQIILSFYINFILYVKLDEVGSSVETSIIMFMKMFD